MKAYYMVKTLLRYPGGKSRAVKALIDYFPEGIELIVSPFLGGASLELALARKGVKVIGCDSFKELVIFWNEVLSNPKRLAEGVQKFLPLSKDEFYSLQKKMPRMKDNAKIAQVFYVLNRTSFSGSTLSGGMSPSHPRFNQASIDRLIKFSVDNFKVECRDFKDTLSKYPDEFLYLDPPYWTKQSLYGIKGSHHKGFDHKELATELSKRDNWILSYNNCPEVIEHYSEYEIVYPEWAYGMTKDKQSKEVLIINIKK
jgi:DNA adenine methylase